MKYSNNFYLTNALWSTRHFKCILFKPILWKIDKAGSNFTPKEADSLKGKAAENSGRAVVGTHGTSLSDISLISPCQLKSVHGTTLPVISLLKQRSHSTQKL